MPVEKCPGGFRSQALFRKARTGRSLPRTGARSSCSITGNPGGLSRKCAPATSIRALKTSCPGIALCLHAHPRDFQEKPGQRLFHRLARLPGRFSEFANCTSVFCHRGREVAGYLVFRYGFSPVRFPWKPSSFGRLPRNPARPAAGRRPGLQVGISPRGLCRPCGG